MGVFLEETMLMPIYTQIWMSTQISKKLIQDYYLTEAENGWSHAQSCTFQEDRQGLLFRAKFPHFLSTHIPILLTSLYQSSSSHSRLCFPISCPPHTFFHLPARTGCFSAKCKSDASSRRVWAIGFSSPSTSAVTHRIQVLSCVISDAASSF